jgi:hypothetical protein
VPLARFQRSLRAWPLFPEILQRDLDAFIVHFLVFGRVVLAALGAAMEEGDYVGNKRTTLLSLERLDFRR